MIFFLVNLTINALLLLLTWTVTWWSLATFWPAGARSLVEAMEKVIRD